MAIKFEVLDGTKEAKWGQAAKRSLEKLAYAMGQRLYVPSSLGKEDFAGYKVTQKLIERNWNQSRDQLYLNGAQNDIQRFNFRNLQDPNFVKLIFLDEDLYADGLNWCFGSTRRDAIYVSTYRLDKSIGNDGTFAFEDLLLHELGHQFGAAAKDRMMTEENLGSHCLVDLCVMQQKTSFREAEDFLERRFTVNALPYCDLCVSDLRKYSR